MSGSENAVITNRGYIIAILLTVIGTVLFSAKAIVIKYAYSYQVDTVTLMTLRMGMAVPIYIAVIIYVEWFHAVERISLRQLSMIMVIGTFGYYLASLLDLQGLHYISANLERMVLYLYPTFVLLISALIYKQAISRTEMLAMLLAYSGIALILLQDVQLDGNDVLIGSGLVLLSALVFAIFVISSDRHIKHVGSLRFTGYAMTAAGIAIFLHYLINGEQPVMALRQEVYWMGFVLAIFSTVIPTFFMAGGIRVLGARKTAMLGVVGPVSTAILASIFLGEILTKWHIIGIILVLSAMVFIAVTKPAQK